MNKNSQSVEVPEESDPTQLRMLAQAISLSPTAMFELSSHPQKLRKKLHELNERAVVRLENEEYNQALIYLQEGQKILEYGVSCGKRIPRAFIISIMQNQACAYQRLWQLQKSADYMEAIIQNMQCEVQINSSLELSEINFCDKSDQKQCLMVMVGKLTWMALYYLQFSAVSSQIKNHQSSFRTARKALKTLKLVCQNSIKIEISSSKSVLGSMTSSMLAEMATVPEEVQLDKASSYFIQAKKYLTKLKQPNTKKNFTHKTMLPFKDFTIGEVMQISSIGLEEAESRLSVKEQLSLVKKLFKAMYISICFFALATESRLCANEKFKGEVRRNSIQFKKSQLYHLKAIYIAAKFIPCQNKYLDHILKSFKNHYEIDLFETTSSELIDEVSSIELESQNFVSPEEFKHDLGEESSQVPLGKSLINHREAVTQTYLSIKKNPTILVKSNQKIKIKYRSKEKLKKTTTSRKCHSKSEKKVNSQTKMGAEKSQKFHNMKYLSKKMHHSLNQKVYSCEKGRVSWNLPAGRKKRANEKEKQGENSRSKSKSGKKTGLKQTLEKEKVKRKNNKLQEEYFVRGDKKKQMGKNLRKSSCSLKRLSRIEFPSITKFHGQCIT